MLPNPVSSVRQMRHSFGDIPVLTWVLLPLEVPPLTWNASFGKGISSWIFNSLLEQIISVSPFSPLTSFNVSLHLFTVPSCVSSHLFTHLLLCLSPKGCHSFLNIFAEVPCAAAPGWSSGTQWVVLICFRAGWNCLRVAQVQQEGYTGEGQLPGFLWEFAWVSLLSSCEAAEALQPIFRNCEDFTSRSVAPIAKMLRSKTTPQEPCT